ncbi:MAG: glucose-1-phosphate adenylyltransferase [Lachnospiraceae bacterium]|nr:glucose-1-phosphate adenylyltransferase [Lachnospiraceae bacterium]
MIKKEMIAMLLAGGQGSRLGVLTTKVAKPAVSFGGKYRIIDFPLSNCINSGIDTVGVLTQYQPLKLNSHIGIGIPWDLDRNIGGVSILPPYEKSKDSEWYTGTANAILQNMEYMESFNPEYVLILSGDHIYKMDYEVMLDFHKESGAECTIAVMPVPWEEASRFGIMIADADKRINDFEEKPKNPRSNLASMGIYIFNWKTLKEALLVNKDVPNLDFGMHVIPYVHAQGAPMYAYEFRGYWKDVGTLSSYWEANMELIDLVPEFNLYEEYWKVYTTSEVLPPQYISNNSEIQKSIIGEGTSIYGKVYNSVIGCGVTIEEGAVVRDSIIMNHSVIGANCELNKAIVAEEVVIGDNVVLGAFEEVDNETHPHIYNQGLVCIGEKTVIPSNVKIGKNTVVSGITTAEDYPDNCLASGKSFIKAGDKA